MTSHQHKILQLQHCLGPAQLLLLSSSERREGKKVIYTKGTQSETLSLEKTFKIESSHKAEG